MKLHLGFLLYGGVGAPNPCAVQGSAVDCHSADLFILLLYQNKYSKYLSKIFLCGKLCFHEVIVSLECGSRGVGEPYSFCCCFFVFLPHLNGI